MIVELHISDYSAFGLDDLEAFFKDCPKHIPYATATALNFLADKAHKSLKDSMSVDFDRPTRWALNGIRVTKASVSRGLESSVWLKDEFAGGRGGTPATKFLAPEIEGGKRHQKRFEKAFWYKMRTLGLPASYRNIVPAKGMKLDRYGNIPNSTIVQLLSATDSFNEQGFSANQTTDTAKKAKYKGEDIFFAPAQGGKNPMLALRTSNDDLKALLVFTERASYKKRWHFYDIAEKAVIQYHDRAFSKAIDDEAEGFSRYMSSKRF
jgi:hypothetical protein